MSAQIQAENLQLSFGSRTILDGVNLNLSTSSKAALAGANGSGKSTLMKVLSGKIQPEAGKLVISNDARVVYLPQTESLISDPEEPLKNEALLGFRRLEPAAERMHQIEHQLEASTSKRQEDHQHLLEEYENLRLSLEHGGWYEREAKIGKILNGLGFKTEDFGRPLSSFSSGFRMRASLARVLIEIPDIALLDEPTNYLDLETRNWLKDFLLSYPGGFLIVSHDRWFLDQSIDQVIELFNGRLHTYRGSYSEYEEKRSQEIEAKIKAYQQQQEEIQKTEQFIRKFRYNANRARQVQSRVKQLDKMDRIEMPEHLRKISIQFPAPPKSGRVSVDLQNVSRSYEGKPVLTDLAREIERGTKLAVTGVNGAGKSTLLRIIAGRDQNYRGDVVLGTGVIPAYFSADEITGEEWTRIFAARELNRAGQKEKGGSEKPSDSDDPHTVLSFLEEAAPTEMIPRLRDMLGSFLFRGDDIYKQITVLSGGERTRLSLLRMLLSPANLLILDEPTNHLDIHSKDILLDALQRYSGTVIFVSHDRGFLRSLASEVLELRGGGAWQHYPGDYDYYLYRKERETENRQSISGRNGSTEKAKPSPSKSDAFPKPASGTPAEQRQRRKDIQRELRRIERSLEEILAGIESLPEKRRKIQEDMARPSVYTDGSKVRELTSRLEELDSEEQRLSLEWEEAESRADSLRAELEALG
ncbi:MAG: ABC-F family ATP-binding cassette domain-containing protein [Spirochaetales bacterium]|nr:ABC-F family ATP-binding cassette domain-containing protein [Spirochaetales bacterium]MCF7939187.1 ABC-F family ATP-binding cassette domain-containing protein [Spirochaetales bacterium]